jgi:hypothetical protein
LSLTFGWLPHQKIRTNFLSGLTSYQGRDQFRINSLFSFLGKKGKRNAAQFSRMARAIWH